MDFTFVCPTEIAEFGKRHGDFQDRDAQVLGMSTDTHFVHLAWRRHHPDLEQLPFPMLADTKRELSGALGILHRGEGVPLRATFIVDPQGVIRWASVNDLSVGRNVDECCACSTRCRPASCARATGGWVSRGSRWRETKPGRRDSQRRGRDSPTSWTSRRLRAASSMARRA